MDIDIVPIHNVFDDRGTLTIAEYEKEIPFVVQRIYIISDVPNSDIVRGFHAHKKLKQFFICISGSCTIKFDDGVEIKEVHLDDKSTGIYVGPGLWRELYNFSNDAILIVLASEKYDEMDYIRDYESFKEVYQ